MSIVSTIKTGVGILNTTLTTTGRIIAQLGTSKKTDSDNAEWWQHVSFVSRPSKPSEDGSTVPRAITIDRGGRDVIVASQDQRGLDLYGNMNFGEFAVYAPGKNGTGQARILGKSDGSLVMITSTDNTTEGAAVIFKLSPTALAFHAPWGSFTFDSSGFHLKTQAGPRIDLGGIKIDGLPEPLASNFGGYAQISAPMVKLKAQNVFQGLGPSYLPASYSPVIAPEADAAHTALVSALVAFVKAVGPAIVAAAGQNPALGTTLEGAITTNLTAALAALPPPKHSNTVWSSK